jgi:hypothetical protein
MIRHQRRSRISGFLGSRVGYIRVTRLVSHPNTGYMRWIEQYLDQSLIQYRFPAGMHVAITV